MGDADLNDPLPELSTAGEPEAGAYKADDGSLVMLTSMGFTSRQVARSFLLPTLQAAHVIFANLNQPS